MVTNKKKHSEKRPAKQGPLAVTPSPNKIGASTPYDFRGKNLSAYGGLLPVATMLEKLGFQSLVEGTLTVKRLTRALTMYQFVLALVLAIYVGFSRLHHLRFVAREPLLAWIVKVPQLPPQCTFWRFLASLHLHIGQQILEVQRKMRERVWAAANSDDRHRHHRAHALRPPDGRPQGLQPEEQRQEELPADLNVLGRDAGIHLRGVAPRGSSDRPADRPASGGCVRGVAGGSRDDLRSSRLGVLLLGGCPGL